MLGNVGEEALTAGFELNLGRLKLDPATLTAVNAETGEAIPLSGKTLKVNVPRHDLCIVLLAPSGKYPKENLMLGNGLPKPKEILDKLSDNFHESELSASWQKDLHEGADAFMWEGRLCVMGNNYGYAHVRPRIGGGQRVGAMPDHEWLWWRRRLGCKASFSTGQTANTFRQVRDGGVDSGKFFYRVSGLGDRRCSVINRKSVPGWYPFAANWVRIVLKPESIECYASADGKTWIKDCGFKRGRETRWRSAVSHAWKRCARQGSPP